MLWTWNERGGKSMKELVWLGMSAVVCFALITLVSLLLSEELLFVAFAKLLVYPNMFVKTTSNIHNP